MKLKENITNVKQALSNSKARVLLLFLLSVAGMAFGVAYIKLKANKFGGAAFLSAVTATPNIGSTPGMGQPTREYVMLQEQENRQLSVKAAEEGTAAIPTFVRSTYLDQGVSADLLPNSGVVSVAGCSATELQRARLSGVTASELHCRGCSAASLKAAGFSAADLKAAGFSAADLKGIGFSAADLKAAGFSAKDLLEAGYNAKDLLEAGFSVGELKHAGFGVEDLRSAGVSPEDLALAGFGGAKLSSTGECSIQKLQLARSKGLSVQDIRKLGCSIEALRAAGYTASELKSAGFSAAELKAAGFSAADLKAAGFSAAELKDAGFGAKDLMAAGFNAEDLKNAGFSAGELRAAGFNAEDLKNAGFSAADLKAAGFSAAELKDAGFSAEELKAAGFTAGDLARAGFTAVMANSDQAKTGAGSCSVESLKVHRNSGVNAAELKKMGCSLEALKTAGFSATDLKKAGFSAAELLAAGLSAGDLKNAGFSAEELKAAGFSAADLKAAGFSANELKQAGFGAAELLTAGFSTDELKQAGFSPDDITATATYLNALKKPIIVSAPKTDLCSIASLKAAKVKGTDFTKLKQVGCAVANLRAAGFNAAELMAAGFTEGELKQAGFSAADINAARLRLAAEANNVKEPAYSSKLTKEQMNNMTAIELDDLMKKQQALMKQQAGELFSAWVQMPAQQYVAGEVQTQEAGGGASARVSADSEQDRAKNFDTYKAGTVVFGILDAEVNTDENSPVMATVIHGSLNGAKVLGTFQRTDKKVLLQFKVISIPRLTNSMAINAVAIDPNTAKTVLASKVDNHYWLRYGTMFATSFIGGLGSAMQNAGAKVSTNANVIQTVLPELDFRQKAIVALGNVGQQFSSVASSLINTQPTVTVKAGTSIGLLLMSDLAVPKSK